MIFSYKTKVQELSQNRCNKTKLTNLKKRSERIPFILNPLLSLSPGYWAYTAFIISHGFIAVMFSCLARIQTLVEDSKNVRAVDTASDATSSGSLVHCPVLYEPVQQGNWGTVRRPRVKTALFRSD